MADQGFDEEKVMARVNGVSGRNNIGKKILRGIYFSIEEYKTAENYRAIAGVQSVIEEKLGSAPKKEPLKSDRSCCSDELSIIG